MGIRDLFAGRRKFEMSDEGWFKQEEYDAAYYKSRKLFEKKLGFDLDEKGMTIDMPPLGNGSTNLSIKLLQNGKEVGELLVNRYSGDYQLQDASNRAVETTTNFGKNHHPAHKGESHDLAQRKSPEEAGAVKVKDMRSTTHMSTQYSVGEKSGFPGDGKYHLVIKELASGTLPAGNGSKITGSVMALVGPDGRYIAEATSLAGGHDHGAPIFKDGVTSARITDIRYSKRLGTDAIYLDDNAFEPKFVNGHYKNREGILIHKELRVAGGSSGCWTNDAVAMSNLLHQIDKIPEHLRPTRLELRPELEVHRNTEQQLAGKIERYGAKMVFHGRGSNHHASVEQEHQGHKHGANISHAELGNFQPPTQNYNPPGTMLSRLFS